MSARGTIHFKTDLPIDDKQQSLSPKEPMALGITVRKRGVASINFNNNGFKSVVINQ